MKKINLRELYPDVYTTDFLVDVTEEVMETIRAAERVLYYRTRIKDANGKLVAIYAKTPEEQPGHLRKNGNKTRQISVRENWRAKNSHYYTELHGTIMPMQCYTCPEKEQCFFLTDVDHVSFEKANETRQNNLQSATVSLQVVIGLCNRVGGGD